MLKGVWIESLGKPFKNRLNLTLDDTKGLEKHQTKRLIDDKTVSSGIETTAFRDLSTICRFS